LCVAEKADGDVDAGVVLAFLEGAFDLEKQFIGFDLGVGVDFLDWGGGDAGDFS